MKKGLLLFILLLSYITSQAKEYPGYYINLKGDTIQCKFNVKVNPFYKDLLNQLSFRKRIKVIHEDGSTFKFKPAEIRLFQIDNTSEGSEVYVPLDIEGKLWFVRLVEQGKISLYQHFFPHGYDGSVQNHYVVKIANKKAKKIPSGFWRKQLLKYASIEWFENKLLDKTIKYKDLPQLVNEFNSM